MALFLSAPWDTGDGGRYHLVRLPTRVRHWQERPSPEAVSSSHQKGYPPPADVCQRVSVRCEVLATSLWRMSSCVDPVKGVEVSLWHGVICHVLLARTTRRKPQGPFLESWNWRREG